MPGKNKKIITCTEAELALLLTPLDEKKTLSVRRVQQLEGEGHVFRVKRGVYDRDRSIRGFIAYLYKRAAGKTETLANKKAVSEDINITEKMLKLMKSEDVLVMRAAVKRELIPIVRAFQTRARALESVLANEIAEREKAAFERGKTGEEISDHDLRVRAQDMIRPRVDEALTELSGLDVWGEGR